MSKANVIVNSEINRKQANLQIPSKLNVPIKFTSPERVKLGIVNLNRRNALEKYSENITPELSNDLVTIYSGIEPNNIHEIFLGRLA